MPAITAATARKMFMRDFARMSADKQDGIIEGLIVIRDATAVQEFVKDHPVNGNLDLTGEQAPPET